MDSCLTSHSVSPSISSSISSTIVPVIGGPPDSRSASSTMASWQTACAPAAIIQRPGLLSEPTESGYINTAAYQ